jgi:hypothetical protein
MKTTIEQIIEKLDSRKHTLMSDLNVQVIDAMIELLSLHLPKERQMIEKAFSDGVGEGLTDPERPFTGKEYYDLRYKKEEK